MRKCNFTIVRHGETEWNKIGMLQGQLDSQLTVAGKIHAEVTAKHLSKNKYDALISSDLGRAYETARIISPYVYLVGVCDPGLREKHCGVLQGEYVDDLCSEDQSIWDKTREDVNFPFPGGESSVQFHDRVLVCFERFAKTYENQHVLIATHAGVMDVITRIVCKLGIGARLHRQYDNCEICELVVDDESWELL